MTLPCEFMVTSDVDWASEDCIDIFCESMTSKGVKPLLFATHASEILLHWYDAGKIDIGIHPNFFPGSDHGADFKSVISHITDFFPMARISRSHGYFDNSRIPPLLLERGIQDDSNCCSIFEPNIQPLNHWSGVRRFPVFWEDDIHWTLGENWDFGRYEHLFFAPGLKIIDVHPFNYAFNISSAEAYGRLKHLTKNATRSIIETNRVTTEGVATFVDAMIHRIAANEIPTRSISELLRKERGKCGLAN